MARSSATSAISTGEDIQTSERSNLDHVPRLPSGQIDEAVLVQGFVSTPAPPPEMWDTDNGQFLEKVKCRSMIRITKIDPKNGEFVARLKCHWTFRTANTQDRTEVHMRVPGIRMPGLLVTCEESRIWRNLMKTTEKSVHW